MLRTNEPLKIYDYSDFRSFLWAYHEARKKGQKTWTMGLWARALGVTSTAVLTNILNGKRNPGADLSEKFIRYFDFSPEEADYFVGLIDLKKRAKNPRQQSLILETLSRKHPSGQFHQLADEQFRVTAKPSITALRELVQAPGFQEDPTWIQKQLLFDLSEREIKRAIEDLLRAGLLVRNSKGKLAPQNEATTTSVDVQNLAIQKFHEEILNLCLTHLHETPVTARDLSGVTFLMDSSRWQEFKNEIQVFRRYMMNKYEASSHVDQVVHLEIALIPLSKKIKNKQEKKNETDIQSN